MIDKSEFYENPTIYQYGYYDGYQKGIKESKASEMLGMLEKVSETIRSLMLSISAHPDCTEDSEFDGYASMTEEVEQDIKQLINEATTL